ncbi:MULTISPECIES: hypothetical protein [Streptomyces]|uniref:Uncharacterized protein n=2 Tax=Streptomyces TaxID=1883 RepID=A0A420UWQ1_9ACTN|nr:MULTISPECIES: hypothetical protein [Streptomyces]KNE83825.1 hypothetical protein ADZ36_02455 [Streptomyces fradiae]OFA55700.1 hypothetical protein BEN35_07095 [Streptomyces fradiae]PQM23953.1 hypothetical protein Sfr7A_10265 [Streptomyces xinghaiensis]RKM91939.1 hypothetical protein SFRA_026170 [Streptomyces xinghaiensis]RNC73645.1 hypothetical protein DC095_016385 [Streptomyces xinghaiensis]
MSDTTPDGTKQTQHPAPKPASLEGLTGAPAAVYTALVGHPDGATVTELALSADVGRSTTGKALTLLEKQGLAVRTPGGHEGARRIPDRWRPAPEREDASGEGAAHAPAEAHPEPSATPAPQPGALPEESNSPVAETAANTGSAPEGSASNASTVFLVSSQQGAPQPDAEAGDAKDNHIGNPRDEDGDSPKQKELQPPHETTGQRPTPPGMATPYAASGKKRLAPGGLRQMVIDHLTAHPGEAFTATKISRQIEKSSGAIANALVTLAAQGVAEQVSEKPRTYRLATSGDK